MYVILNIRLLGLFQKLLGGLFYTIYCILNKRVKVLNEFLIVLSSNRCSSV